MSTRGDGFLIGRMQKRQGRIISKKVMGLCTLTRWTQQYTASAAHGRSNTDTEQTVERFTVPHKRLGKLSDALF